MGDTPSFSLTDYSVMALMLFFSSGIGIYFAWKDRRDQSNKAFLLGNRELGVFPVAMSLMASFQSATTVLGYPAEMFYKGTQFWVAIFGLALSNVLAAEVFLPVLYNLQLTSVNLYLERRFYSVPVRTLGSLSFIINTLLYMGVVLYGPSVALQSVTGLPVWISILILGLICTLYTVLGGMKAVVWTDALQMTIMVMGLASVVVLGTAKVGTISDVWARARGGGRIQFLNTQVDLQSSVVLWNVLLGTTFIWLASYGTSQTQVQRFCSVSTLKKARIALYINIPGVMLNISLGCLAGLVIYANYYDCDPLKAGKIKMSDELIPYFVMEALNVVPGLPGLFVACVFSGALSTLSSGFNSLAAVTWEDFLVRWSNFSDRQAAYITRSVAAFYGFLTLGLAFVAGRVGSILKAAFAMSGALSGPLLGVFTMGVLVPLCNGKGALIGLLLGQMVCLWVVVGSLLHKSPNENLPTSSAGCQDNSTEPIFSTQREQEAQGGLLVFYHLSHLLVPVLGFMVTFFTGILVSLLTGRNTGRTQDPALFYRCAVRFLSETSVSQKEHEKQLSSGSKPFQQSQVVNLHMNPTFVEHDVHQEDPDIKSSHPSPANLQLTVL